MRVSCSGTGCPYSSRLYHPAGHTLRLAPAFAHHKLPPGTSIHIAMSDGSDMGKLETFRVRAGAAPALSVRYLPPVPSPPVAG